MLQPYRPSSTVLQPCMACSWCYRKGASCLFTALYTYIQIAWRHCRSRYDAIVVVVFYPRNLPEYWKMSSIWMKELFRMNNYYLLDHTVSSLYSTGILFRTILRAEKLELERNEKQSILKRQSLSKVKNGLCFSFYRKIIGAIQSALANRRPCFNFSSLPTPPCHYPVCIVSHNLRTRVKFNSSIFTSRLLQRCSCKYCFGTGTSILLVVAP